MLTAACFFFFTSCIMHILHITFWNVIIWRTVCVIKGAVLPYKRSFTHSVHLQTAHIYHSHRRGDNYHECYCVTNKGRQTARRTFMWASTRWADTNNRCCDVFRPQRKRWRAESSGTVETVAGRGSSSLSAGEKSIETEQMISTSRRSIRCVEFRVISCSLTCEAWWFGQFGKKNRAIVTILCKTALLHLFDTWMTLNIVGFI